MGNVQPRLYRGFRDVFSAEVTARRHMIDTIRSVYESYGFVPLETPAVEFVDVLGKYLPEADTTDEGIFAFRNEDAEWVALRYDLTAPLSRVVAQYPELPKPFRRYQTSSVWRKEKPGPGRFREFTQFDFDTVGSASITVDAEACAILCDVLEALGIQRGDFLVKANNRKILNGVLEVAGLLQLDREQTYKTAAGASVTRRITSTDVLRSIDKLDKVGLNGVQQLLTKGRLDPSGDFMPGLELSDTAVQCILDYLAIQPTSRAEVLAKTEALVTASEIGREGVNELAEIDSLLNSLGYGDDRVIFDPTIVRGLGYYTGPVFEAALTFETVDENGVTKAFGSVAGGGRYDGLVERFTGQKIPATGASIGVDRLLAALRHIGRVEERASTAEVLIVVMDRNYTKEMLGIAQQLRQAGIRVEFFHGTGGIKAQLKYADHCDIPLALIAGSNEFETGTVQIKNLWLGRELSKEVAERETWRKERPAQMQVTRGTLVETVRSMLDEMKGGADVR